MFLALTESIQLIPDGTILVHIAIIITMIFILNTILYKPISRVLSERENRTRGRLVEAQRIIERVDNHLASYEVALRQGRAEGYNFLERQQLAAYSEKQQQIALLREEIEKKVNQQKSDIEAQASEARSFLKEEARQVAENISFQILER